MKVEVYRDSGDRPCPTDIIDDTLATEIGAIARGKREIDAGFPARRVIERGNCPLLPYMAPGSLVRVVDDTGGYRGKLKLYAFTLDLPAEGEFSATSAVTIERIEK